MQRKPVLTSLVVAAALATAPAGALAASTGNRGQPNQDCEALGTFTPGFQTAGFKHATDVYAAGTANPKAVSQYDVACFQQTSR